jgi:AbrB family looped-hinge helix DNA binding protein
VGIDSFYSRDWSWSARFDTGAVRRYLTYMKTTVSSKGQIVLPAEFRQLDGVEAGQQFDVERIDRGEYRLVRRLAPPNEGAVDWLLACPGKDFFVPIESESTDAL